MGLAPVEALFVETFIARDLRERWRTRLASPRTRPKLLYSLAHTGTTDLDARYVYDQDAVPTPVAARVAQALMKWKQADPQQLCYIIAVSSARDGQWMRLADVATDYELTFGAIIVVIPHMLAYYHTERSNMNKQPFYVLFRS